MLRNVLPAAAALTVALTSAAFAAEITIRIGTTSPDADNPQKRAFTAMSEYIAFRSAGTMEVEVFYGGSLGGDRELLEQVQGGSLQFCVVADGAVANFFPPIQAVAIPYLFTSSAHALAFFNESDFFQGLADEMRQETGMRIMGAAESGFRNFTNNERPIRTPEDMQGLRMRTMESPVFMALMDSLGAAPTPIAFNELIMSLRQGVVDGQENAVTTVRNFGLWEVQKYMSIDEHVYSPGLMVTNDDFYAGLTPGQRQIFADGAWVYATVLNAGALAAYSADVAFLKENGVEIYVNTAEEKEAFRAAAQPAVVSFIAEQVGQERVDALLAAVEQTRQSMYAAD